MFFIPIILRPPSDRRLLAISRFKYDFPVMAFLFVFFAPTDSAGIESQSPFPRLKALKMVGSTRFLIITRARGRAPLLFFSPLYFLCLADPFPLTDEVLPSFILVTFFLCGRLGRRWLTRHRGSTCNYFFLVSTPLLFFGVPSKKRSRPVSGLSVAGFSFSNCRRVPPHFSLLPPSSFSIDHGLDLTIFKSFPDVLFYLGTESLFLLAFS